MKQQFFKFRYIFSVLAITGVMLGTAGNSFARKQKDSAIQASVLQQPKVEFVKADDNAQLFKVSFDAPKTVKFVLTISDERGEQLYSEAFEAASFSKYVRLVNEGVDLPSKFYFTLLESQSGTKHTFGVTTETLWVKDVVITKL